MVRAATVAMQRAIHTANSSGAVFSVLRGPCLDFIRETVWRNKGTPIIKKSPTPPFYQRRNNERREKKSWHWTNIWSWVPAGLDARSDRAGWLPAVSYCSALLWPTEFTLWQMTYYCRKGLWQKTERQTRPLVREGAPQKQDHNCQIVINIWSWAPDEARHQDWLAGWPSVAMWLWL
jgi:hypothetical protein